MSRSIQRIVFATDFSHSARVALAWATRFATTLGADLHVVHAWQVPIMVGPAGAYLASPDMSGELESELSRELEKVCEGRPVAGRHLMRSTPEDAVRTVVAQVKADLVIVGTQGGSALAHVLFGSVAERILRTSTVPVVLIPRNFEELLTRAELVRRVLAPVELGPDAASVIEEAMGIARAFKAPLDVVTVTDLPPYLERHASLAADAEAALLAELNASVKQAGGEGAKDVVAQLLLGKPGPKLIQYVDDTEVDLVVMRTHGRGTLERFFLGSVTERVIRNANVAVMVLPSTETPAI